MSFENTRFVIIGASGGIGSALSRKLKSHGAQPILLGRSAADRQRRENTITFE